MTSNDLFATHDPDGTVVIPRPGGGHSRPAEPREPPPPTVATVGGLLREEMPFVGPNPLIASAATLLELALRLKTCASYNNVDALRKGVIDELGKFEQRLRRSDSLTELLRVAHYIVCAMVDDVVLNTPWGSTSIWSQQSMVSTFHKEATGGERFFDMLEQAKTNVSKYLPFLELAHVCLSLGFLGQYRMRPDGPQKLAAIRDDVYQIISSRATERDRDLSPHWRGMDVIHKPLHSLIPSWVIIATAAVLALLLFLGLFNNLGDHSDSGFALLARTLPVGPPKPPARQRPAPKVVVPVVVPPAPDKSERLRKLLDAEIRDGLVEVKETADTVLVSIRSNRMFDSGSAVIRSELSESLDRIGQSLRDEPYDILVTGHTDNVPIRSMKYPSNWKLSLERARAVQGALAKQLGSQRRIEATGLADTKPVADNDTPEGRERNRRVEIVLYKKLPSSTGL